MILFGAADAALCNSLLEEWGHYLGPVRGPRMVMWYALWLHGEPVGVAVSASPRGATCAGYPWLEVVELARLCSHPDHRDLTRVTLRCWRKVAAQHWADRYLKTIRALAAYSDSTRHPGSIYRADGWRLYDERRRGGGGCAGRPVEGREMTPKRLWVWELERPAVCRQPSLLGMSRN